MRVKGSFRRLLLVAAMTLASVTASVVAFEAPAQAAACYGASCNGLNPEGRCSGDAKTVRGMDVGDGMLQLRWSPSCVANWGRFTPYSRTEASYAAAGIGIWARVTVWNPNKPSYGTAYHALHLGESTWSFMTDGRLKACTGVEIFHFNTSASGSMGDMESQGWIWGPCY